MLTNNDFVGSTFDAFLEEHGLLEECNSVAKNRLENGYTFHVKYSEEDNQLVGLCKEYPSLSWLANSYVIALRGIMFLVTQAIEDELNQSD